VLKLNTGLPVGQGNLIRASEIADWCFCKRSSYLNDQDFRPSLVQIEKRDDRIQYHVQHAQKVKRERTIMSIATYALLLILLFSAAYCFWTNAR
jgi:hypothetical protein